MEPEKSGAWRPPPLAKYCVPLDRYRGGLHYMVLVAYLLIATLPQIRHVQGTDPHTRGWPIWSFGCTAAIMGVAAASDHLRRPPMARVALVLIGIVGYWGVLWPVMMLAGNLMEMDSPLTDLGTMRVAWSSLNTTAGIPLVIFALRSSWLLERRD